MSSALQMFLCFDKEAKEANTGFNLSSKSTIFASKLLSRRPILTGASSIGAYVGTPLFSLLVVSLKEPGSAQEAVSKAAFQLAKNGP